MADRCPVDCVTRTEAEAREGVTDGPWETRRAKISTDDRDYDYEY